MATETTSPYWWRFGSAPLGAPVIPVPPTAVFFLAFVDENGREDNIATYDPATGLFSALAIGPRLILEGGTGIILEGGTPIVLEGGGRVQFLTAPARFLIDGQVVLRLEGGILYATLFTELGPPPGPAIVFKVMRGPTAETWAVVSRDGVVYAPHIEQVTAFPIDTQVFSLAEDGVVGAEITGLGLFALGFEEFAPLMDGGEGFALAFGDDFWAGP